MPRWWFATTYTPNVSTGTGYGGFQRFAWRWFPRPGIFLSSGMAEMKDHGVYRW